MRIKALTIGSVPVLTMGNGAGEKITTLPNNSTITLTSLVRDGANTYYYSEDAGGYIKKDYLKILRDEEFYYSSSLLQTKNNRSSTSFFALARSTVTPYSNITDAKNDTQVPTTQKTNVGTIALSILTGGLISPYDHGKSAAVSASAAGTLTSNTSGTVSGNTTTVSRNKWSGLDTSKTAAAIASGIMSTISSSGTAGSLVNTGINMLESFARTGSWDQANNMNLGGVFGGSNSTLGKLMNGATINNLSNGSFFQNQLRENTTKMIGSYINTLLTKLNYVVGFNLSGIILNTLDALGLVKQNSFIGEIYYNKNIVRRPINFYDIDTQIENYFRYKGCNYKMITRYGDAGQKWEQEAYFNTPTLASKKDPNEVRVYQSIYNTFYSEFESAINTAKDAVNLNITQNDWFVNFNRYRLIHPDSVLTGSKGYIFFTRPDLNISTDCQASDVGTIFFNIAGRYPNIVKSLSKNFASDHQLIPILSNRCTGLDIQNEQIETRELGDTLTGWKLTYGMNNIKSRSASSVTTSFIDDQNLSIYAMFKMWSEYISSVSRGIISPKVEYIRQKQLDYACSIFYFLCSEDGENIIFWTKFTGCIPTSVPSSNFSDSIESRISVPKYSIDWQYAFKRDLDPMTLAEFNTLSGSSFDYQKIYNSESIRSAKTISGAPFIETTDGGKTFKLRFRKKYQ